MKAGVSESAERAVAGVLAPPPVVYAAALAAGVGLETLLPSPRIPRRIARPVGGILLGAGGAVAGLFLRAFRRAGTPIDVGKPASSLVTAGLYRISRNPGYLGLTLMYAGIATLARAPWAFVTLVPALVVVDRFVIAREERYLLRRFGGEYAQYMSRTRRWL